jgi:SAM-dependent methyltransferase
MMSAYAFDDPDGRDAEQARLARQSRLFDPLTQRVWSAAGLSAGMRVLDLGSGAGDVTMLTARIVGPDGHVLGVERDPDAVAASRKRAQSTGTQNVEFVVGDITDLHIHGRFDAVVGRLVLMFVPDPVAVLRGVHRLLRPGGLICVHEIVPRAQLSAPETPLFAEVDRLICAAFHSTGAPIDLGERLPALFHVAGLSTPELRYERVAGAVQSSLTWWYRDVLTGLLPTIERAGLATGSDLDLDSLPDRLDAELRTTDGITTLPPLIGAWSRSHRTQATT